MNFCISYNLNFDFCKEFIIIFSCGALRAKVFIYVLLFILNTNTNLMKATTH